MKVRASVKKEVEIVLSFEEKDGFMLLTRRIQDLNRGKDNG